MQRRNRLLGNRLLRKCSAAARGRLSQRDNRYQNQKLQTSASGEVWSLNSLEVGARNLELYFTNSSAIYRVQRRALEQLITAHPEAQTVIERAVQPDAADFAVVFLTQ